MTSYSIFGLRLAGVIWGVAILAGPGIAVRALEGEVTVLFLGDSLTAGYGLDESAAYPALIEQRIAERGWRARVVNAGVSGDTSAGGLRRLDWLLRQRIDVLVLALGANDGLRGVAVGETERNLQAILDRALGANPELEVIVAGMLVPPNMGAEYSESFAAIFPRLAERNGVGLVPFLLEGVAGETELNQADGIHPTAEGQKRVADTVWGVLEPVLERVVSVVGQSSSDEG